jgi:hypothetical protein
MCCTEDRSAIATNDYIGKGSSHWCREFELARVISFDLIWMSCKLAGLAKAGRHGVEAVTASTGRCMKNYEIVRIKKTVFRTPIFDDEPIEIRGGWRGTIIEYAETDALLLEIGVWRGPEEEG